MGGYSCKVHNCPSSMPSRKSFFGLPKHNDVQRNLWIKRLNLDANFVKLCDQNGTTKNKVVICQDHFNAGQFLNTQKTRLKRNAIPLKVSLSSAAIQSPEPEEPTPAPTKIGGKVPVPLGMKFLFEYKPPDKIGLPPKIKPKLQKLAPHPKDQGSDSVSPSSYIPKDKDPLSIEDEDHEKLYLNNRINILERKIEGIKIWYRLQHGVKMPEYVLSDANYL